MSTAQQPNSPMPASEPERGSPLFIFAGGGSGGHIYPGLAIAEELLRQRPALSAKDILFVVSDRPLDEQILAASPFPFVRSPAKPAIRSIMGVFRFSLGWKRAVRQARPMLKRRSQPGAAPVHVVAMGGFVAAPLVQVAKQRGIPVTMVNLDAIPGKANRYIAGHADRIFTAARVPAEHRAGREWIEVPPIVRAGARATTTREEARRTLNLDPARPVLMITGGSQGLRSLNDFAKAFAQVPAGQRTLGAHGWQVLHQTGRNLDDAARAAYQHADITATVVPFTDQIGLWYAAADLALCTAGAGNIAEIWQNKTPALLLPYPHHKDEHQKFNAAPLAECGGAIVGKDWIDAPPNVRHNGPALEALLTDPAKRAAMRESLERLGPADGAQRIAQALLDALPPHPTAAISPS